MPKKLITIHGINTKGEWQEDVGEVLGPHFECSSIKYPDYRWFGETKILLEPRVLVLGMILSFWLSTGPISLVLYVAATLMIAMLVSGLIRIRTLRSVKEEVDRLTATGRPPHVIAHSF